MLHRSDELDADLYERVVYGREAVEVAPELLAAVDASRDAMLAHLAAGAVAYGVNTGLGYLATRRIAPEDQAALQRSILLGRAVGVGEPHAEEIVRGVMLLRLAGFLSGYAGVSSALCSFLAARLNDGWRPFVPLGPGGSSGEIIALSHLFQTFLGEGFVVEGAQRVPARDALARRGVEPYVPGAKEGAALVNGAPFAVALSLPLARRARDLLDNFTVAAAIAAALVGASRRPFSRRVGHLKGDPGQQRVHDRLIELLGAGAWEDKLQAPVSFRVVPQVHGAALDVLSLLEAQLARELHAVTDGPLFLPAAGDEPEGFYPSGNFHSQALSFALDALAIALAQVGVLAEKRLHRLLDARFSGLPEQLAVDPGRHSGVVVVHKAVVGLCAENRRLAAPASLDSSDTSAGQEDVQAFTFGAAAKLGRLLDNLELALAYELVALRQARSLKREPLPAPLEAVADALSELVQPVVKDRPLGPDVERVLARVKRGTLP